ncbi:hypothetical protein STRDD13_00336 [Streptococcus sp. DD13]|nr:hypothetical protein STRDD13_00336 [Streptococcus sp. DD13]
MRSIWRRMESTLNSDLKNKMKKTVWAVFFLIVFLKEVF